ncbi:aldo/keto reductase, partial [Chitinophaga sp.]|uniref:aldo/keto reductase n=1 Tax=Chitinophaga sp. TaxID=1869181 RepID=UPI002CFE14F6
MTTITKIALGKNGPMVSKLGLGCMRMSPVWGSKGADENESIATIQAALDNGINFLNTGDFYGSGHNELLVGKAIKGRRDDAFISVKFGAIIYGGQMRGLDLRPVAIRNFINYSLVRLGIDTIDLYQPCRLDNSVPVEDVTGTIADLIKEGKVRHLGVSEITADQLRKANSVHPVTALEIGYSLADRQIESDLLPTAKELGVGVVAFANTAEGLLTGDMKAPLPDNAYQLHFSRFQGDNLVKNLEKVEVLKQMAKDKGYTPTQLAIAWVNAQGDHIMPLVSMSRRSRLPENTKAMEITFTPGEIDTLNT